MDVLKKLFDLCGDNLKTFSDRIRPCLDECESIAGEWQSQYDIRAENEPESESAAERWEEALADFEGIIYELDDANSDFAMWLDDIQAFADSVYSLNIENEEDMDDIADDAEDLCVRYSELINAYEVVNDEKKGLTKIIRTLKKYSKGIEDALRVYFALDEIIEENRKNDEP